MANKHGGKREGAGRKTPKHPEGKTSKLVSCVPDKLIAKLRKRAKQQKQSPSAVVTELIRNL